MDGVDRRHCVVLKDGKFDTDEGTSADDLHKIFEAIGQKDDTKVVLHFHGGLTDKQGGIAIANDLTPTYQTAGAYPMFFIWESGWQEVIQQNLPQIAGEAIFQRILTYVTQFAKAKIDKGAQTGVPRAAGALPIPRESTVRDELNVPSDGREPFADVDPRRLPKGDGLTDEERSQFEDRLRDDPVFDMVAAEIAGSLTPPDAAQPAARGATVRGSTSTLMSPDVVRQLTTAEDGSRGVFSTAMLIGRCALALAAVINRFARRRDHGFYLTIVEEILRAFYAGNAGRFLWDGMKQDIVDSFGVGPECGGSRFLTELDTLWRSGKRPRITIVGHSAGAIYACDLLQKVQSRGLPEDLHFNLILIAPACDFKLFAETLQDAGNRINGLRVFGMGDDLERKDAIVPVVYPSSLLYCVSGVIEQEDDCPLVGMARYYSAPYASANAFPGIDYVRTSSPFQKNHLPVWAISTAGDGLNCDMKTHGGWANAQATRSSVVYLIKEGF